MHIPILSDAPPFWRYGVIGMLGWAGWCIFCYVTGRGLNGKKK